MVKAMQDAGADRLVRRGLKITHLRLLASLGRTGQIGVSAGKLAMTQPAASRLLADVERIAGASLYVRHSRGIRLTEAGNHFCTLAQRLLGDLDAAAREIEELDSGRRGFVSIGAVTGAALEHVLPVLKQLRVTHPHIMASVVVDTSDKLVPMLLADQLDLCIGRIPPTSDRSAFIEEPVGPEAVTLIVREGHPLARHTPLSLERCVEFDWVLQPLGGLMRQTVESYLVDRGIPLPARFISTSSTLITLALVSQSNAIAPIALAAADFFGNPESLGGRIVCLPVAPDLAVPPYSLLRPAHRELSPTSRIVHEQIRARTAARKAADGISI